MATPGEVRSLEDFNSEDEEVLTSTLINMRGERLVILAESQHKTNPDTRAFLEALAEDLLKRSRAIHRALHRLGVRGLGPMV